MPICLHILPVYRTMVKNSWNGVGWERTDEKSVSSKKVSSVTGFMAATGVFPFP